MAKTETIRARVDAKLKAQAEGILDKLGLNASDAIRLFYRQVALQKHRFKKPCAVRQMPFRRAGIRHRLDALVLGRQRCSQGQAVGSHRIVTITQMLRRGQVRPDKVHGNSGGGLEFLFLPSCIF